MKSRINIIWPALAVLTLSFVLSAFITMPGSDSYEVFLGDKLMLQQYLHGRKTTPSLLLDDQSNQQINVMYNQCGQTGTSRKITLKNDKREVLKEWRFKDVDVHTKDGMIFAAKDIVAFKKSDKGLSLYYSANERDEVALASIEWSQPTAQGH